MLSKVKLRLLPSPRCLFDDVVRVKVEGLVPEQQVELRAKLRDDNATVWINGCNANVMLPLHYKGMVIPPLMFDAQRAVLTKSGALDIKASINDPMAEENKGTLIPIERAEGRFLFVAAEDDKNWDSCYFAEQAIKQLRHHGKQNYEVVTYPGAGHYMETPYMPFCPSSMHRVLGQPVIWGGEPRAHAAAEVDLWKRIQLFFRSHLVEGRSCRKAQL
ncbi:hypothetical protein AAFF_G00414570 [Aldrovandia affinis]|uniref:BAAT/Acyl-CoA thioester hydrolase C-terminal domain-containing protein n=1 Tax=Aldrovandia affinis TaxID=143900 RepID=A0AAD7SB24_9TELE|nr:hypothetical protein AAFF_G00414570 [Aldrovandia affinis]